MAIVIYKDSTIERIEADLLQSKLQDKIAKAKIKTWIFISK